MCNILRAILSRGGGERPRKDNSEARLQVLGHRIFNAVNDIVRGLDRLEFSDAKDIIGKSLREDYSFIEQQQKGGDIDVR